MAGKREEQLKEITKRLEQGVKELFTSEKYTKYLETMAQFHNYSFQNTMLIAMQRPDATLVAGYGVWNKKFNRHVRRGEKGIQILAPVPVRHKEKREKFDPKTNEPILRPDGQPETEEVEHIIPRFRVATVFDVLQTEGEPLPTLDTPELIGNVKNFPVFMEAIQMVSPVPMRYAQIEGEANGYYSSTEKEIVIQNGMSQMQTMKTAVHEVTHALCHDKDIMEERGEKKSQRTKEVESESVAFTVCNFFGIDTAGFSFPYITGWSGSIDMKELRSSMEFIRKTAGAFIDSMVENMKCLQKEKESVRELSDDDLVFQVALSGEDARRFYLVDNVGRVDFLRLLYTFAEQKGEKKSPEQFLKEHGVHLDLWQVSENPENEEDVPGFYDVLYMDRDHIVDAATSHTLVRVELMIARAEYGHTKIGSEEHNMAVRHAYKLDDLVRTKKLIADLVHAAENPETGNGQKIMEDAQAEIDALPDNKAGILQMHDYGFRNDFILPLTKERAVTLYHAGLPIYQLHKDSSFTLINKETEILGADEMFGVDKAAWENYLAAENGRGRDAEKEESGMQEEVISETRKIEEKTASDEGISSETDREKIREDYQEVEIFGVPALFANGRIAENDVPEGICRYDLRGSGDDPGNPVAVENRVAVNHAGTILTAQPLPIPERGFLYLGEELNFAGGNLAPERLQEYFGRVDAAGLEEKMQDAVIRANEELLYTDTADRYAVFQIDETGKGREYLFSGLDSLKKRGLEVAGGDYLLVYGGRLGQGENLNTIYDKFNNSHPKGYTGHSLSVSDVVVVNRGGEVSAHFVDRFGFTDLPDFVHQREQVIREAKTQDLEETMYPPLYTQPFSYAKDHGETDAYHASGRLNWECRQAVQDAVREKFDGKHLAHDAAEDVLEEYGPERVTFILANTVQHLEHDGRFSKDTKEWAKSFAIPEHIEHGRDVNARYIVTSHPAVLDGFIGLARETMQEQELWWETEVQISAETRGFAAAGHFGTWHTAEIQEINGEKFYRMEHDAYGDSAASIVVDQDGKLVAKDLEHGFDQGAVEAIREYLAEKGSAWEQEARTPLSTDQVQTEPSITFYASEYAIMPVLGEYHEGLKTLQEALDYYDRMPVGKKNAIKGVGFCLEDGSEYAGRCELMTAGIIQKVFINDIPHYRDSPLVQKAIADMEMLLADREKQHRQSTEKETEPRQTVTLPNKEEKSAEKNGEERVPISEAVTEKTAEHEPAKHGLTENKSDEKGRQTEVKQPEPEKAAEKALKPDRNTTGVSKKQSVLNALRERQAKLKAQEKQGQKSKARGKGGPEL